MDPAVRAEIVSRWLELLPAHLLGMAGGAVAALLIATAWARWGWSGPPGSSWTARASRLGATLLVPVALGLAVRRASVVDDAFISLRYARNLLQGNGLVWNVGERVEGFTNLLWTLMLAGGMGISGADGPQVALALSLAALAAAVSAAAVLGRAICAPHRPSFHLPIAAAWLAVQSTFVSFGTTGMETVFAAGLVMVGAGLLATRDDPRGALWAGSALVAATLTHPDHALFYAVGGAVLLAPRALPLARALGRGPTARAEAGLPLLLAYAAPSLALVGVTAWRSAYYGDVVPNTFHAKAVALWNVPQGLAYALTFALGSHGWLLAVPFLAVCALPSPSRPARRLRAFAALATAVWTLYVLRIGGDFMYGRFWVPLLPLLALVLEEGIHDLARRTRTRGRAPVAAVALAALVGATWGGMAFVRPGRVDWWIADENTIYPVTRWSPLEIDHTQFRLGRMLGRELRDRGIRVRLATKGIGMIGWYSRQPVVDLVGLTDRRIARQPVVERTRPGHEKSPPRGYLVRRRVHFVRAGANPKEYDDLARIDFGRGTGERWSIVVYDREVMARIRDEVPGIRFTDFEAWLDDYVSRLPGTPPEQVARDLAWFRRYYFAHNDDPARLGVIEAAAAGGSTERGGPTVEAPASPAG